ncbi:hypothetical protein DR999_PMT11545 [Platysternon megacephalum]|uniref:Uncharacterized protein n=1 Tax=Platysternon megacephalum TaxID=55544 RepID=A0A4D9EE19_9SAUR|nr:hypothetical protein DR999_PMT11545 [Platysternon megacephalum]
MASGCVMVTHGAPEAVEGRDVGGSWVPYCSPWGGGTGAVPYGTPALRMHLSAPDLSPSPGGERKSSPGASRVCLQGVGGSQLTQAWLPASSLKSPNIDMPQALSCLLVPPGQAPPATHTHEVSMQAAPSARHAAGE